MSQENVKLLFKEMEKNETLREKLGTIKQEEDFIAAANESGFSFDLEHLHAFLIEQRKTRSAALSDDEIANVTGGGAAAMQATTDDGIYTTDGYLIMNMYGCCFHFTQSPFYRGMEYNGICLGCAHFVIDARTIFGYCLIKKKP